MKEGDIEKREGATDWIMYNTPNGKVHIEIYVQDETVWLTQQKIADLFGVDRTVITKHLKNIFEENELTKDSVCAIFAHTAADGKTYKTQFYNLDAILSVGYRVSSKQATQFRIWASQVLKEYLIKGFAMDDERLKNPHGIFGKDYFDEQLERIRDILEKLPTRKNQTKRCCCGKKLSEKRGIRRTQPHRLDVPRLRRKSSKKGCPHVHERLGSKIGHFLAI